MNQNERGPTFNVDVIELLVKQRNQFETHKEPNNERSHLNNNQQNNRLLAFMLHLRN